jgi:hypothetical protein
MHQGNISDNKDICEVARINLKEDTNGTFPYNVWKLQIFSEDTLPPHFHILKEEWDVSFCIEDGAELCINSKGTDIGIYKYMCTQARNWLVASSALLPKLTNREMATLVWEQLHDTQF